MTVATALQNKNKNKYRICRSTIFFTSRYKSHWTESSTNSSNRRCHKPPMPYLNENRVFEVKKSEIQQAARSGQARSQRSAMNHWVSRGTATLAVVTGLALITTPASARWYKWVDEEGNISYQDRPPPSSFEQSTQVLSDHGVTLKTIPSQQEQLELDRQARIDRERKQRDEALLKAFPSESDLINTRDKRVLHIDGSISRMHDQLVILNTRLISIEGRIEERVERNLEPSSAFDSDRIAVLRSIDSTNALIKAKLRERRQIMAQFDRDLVRYRELRLNTTAYSD